MGLDTKDGGQVCLSQSIVPSVRYKSTHFQRGLGFWAVFVAGFSPIPYKMFIISAGAMNMVLSPFVLASIIGRGGRFFLVAMLLAAGSAKLELKLREYMDRLGNCRVSHYWVGTYRFFYRGVKYQLKIF